LIYYFQPDSDIKVCVAQNVKGEESEQTNFVSVDAKVSNKCGGGCCVFQLI